MISLDFKSLSSAEMKWEVTYILTYLFMGLEIWLNIISKIDLLILFFLTRSLSFVYQTIREFEQNQDTNAIQNYLEEMNFQYMEESMRILAEYTIVKC